MCVCGMADDVSSHINRLCFVTDFVLLQTVKSVGEVGTKIETLVNKLTRDYWINLCVYLSLVLAKSPLLYSLCVCATMGPHCWRVACGHVRYTPVSDYLFS